MNSLQKASEMNLFEEGFAGIKKHEDAHDEAACKFAYETEGDDYDDFREREMLFIHAALSLSDTDDNPEHKMLLEEKKRVVRAAISNLGPKERKVINDIFGFSDECKDISTVASEMGLSLEKAQNILSVSLGKLQTYLTPYIIG